MNLTWKDVFNCFNLFPCGFNSCLIKVKECGYKYMAFNGRVFDVNETDGTHDYIMLQSELDK